MAPVALTAAAHCLVLALLRMRQHNPGLMGPHHARRTRSVKPLRESPARGSANDHIGRCLPANLGVRWEKNRRTRIAEPRQE